MTQQHHNNRIGSRGEQAVALYFEHAGFNILYTNVHTRYGEIDIIMVKEGVIHIVEVKTRTNALYGDILTTLTRQKFYKMRKAVAVIQNTHQLSKGRIQFDFAAVTITPEKKFCIEMQWNIGEIDFE